MTGLEVKISLGKSVLDNNNEEKKLWSLNIFGCFWKIHLSKDCDD